MGLEVVPGRAYSKNNGDTDEQVNRPASQTPASLYERGGEAYAQLVESFAYGEPVRLTDVFVGDIVRDTEAREQFDLFLEDVNHHLMQFGEEAQIDFSKDIGYFEGAHVIMRTDLSQHVGVLNRFLADEMAVQMGNLRSDEMGDLSAYEVHQDTDPPVLPFEPVDVRGILDRAGIDFDVAKDNVLQAFPDLSDGIDMDRAREIMADPENRNRFFDALGISEDAFVSYAIKREQNAFEDSHSNTWVPFGNGVSAP